jgi:hypothetical protein
MMAVTDAGWCKSSYSNGGTQGACVEVAIAWSKSSYSGSGGQQNGCIEVARHHPDAVAVRDSKDPDGPRLTFAPADWQAFTRQVKAGRHGLA